MNTWFVHSEIHYMHLTIACLLYIEWHIHSLFDSLMFMEMKPVKKIPTKRNNNSMAQLQMNKNLSIYTLQVSRVNMNFAVAEYWCNTSELDRQLVAILHLQTCDLSNSNVLAKQNKNKRYSG